MPWWKSSARLRPTVFFSTRWTRARPGCGPSWMRCEPGVVLESEIALPLERVADHHLSWAQWFGDSEVPGVLRNKWFERRHLQHQIKRWDRDHSGELHTAWMNGSGMMIWENVFGTWVGWNARDRSILRALLPIQRRFADVFTGEKWTPLVPTEQPDVYASEWGDDNLRLWTLVNRSEKRIDGDLLKVSAAGERLFRPHRRCRTHPGSEERLRRVARADSASRHRMLCRPPTERIARCQLACLPRQSAGFEPASGLEHKLS